MTLSPLDPTECIGLNHQLVNVVALGALKRAEIETHTYRPDASEHHVSLALWAGGTIDLQVDVFRQKIGFLHDVFPQGGGSATLPVTGGCLWVVRRWFNSG